MAGQGNILAGHTLDGWVSKDSEGLFLFVMDQAAFIRQKDFILCVDITSTISHLCSCLSAICHMIPDKGRSADSEESYL